MLVDAIAGCSLGVRRGWEEEAHVDLANPGLERYYRPDGHLDWVSEDSKNNLRRRKVIDGLNRQNESVGVVCLVLRR